MKIILASKSGVRKQILDKYKIDNEVMVSNVDENEIKESLLAEGADPLIISKNLAEIKSIKVSNKNPDRLVLGADSVVSLNNELINKPSKYAMPRLNKEKNLIEIIAKIENTNLFNNSANPTVLQLRSKICKLEKYPIRTRKIPDIIEMINGVA